MAKRGNDLFVTFLEFSSWISDLTNELSLVVLLDRGPDDPIARWGGDKVELEQATRVFLTTNPPELGRIESKGLNPAELGWVVLDVPRTVGGALRLCQIGARSDWWDSKQSKVRENPESIRLYDKVWRRLKKRLAFPVWAKNVSAGAESPYRSLGYSEGAKQWSRRGGSLAQEGVSNIRFEIRDG